MSGDLAAMTGAPAAVRRFPPVAELAIGSLTLVVIGGNRRRAGAIPVSAPVAAARSSLIASPPWS